MSEETSDTQNGENARFHVPEGKAKAAAKWFEQAKKLVGQRNYEYAIKSFIEGLTLNPEAIEEGWQALRGCAVARWQTGGKKPGMMDTVKFSMTTKDPIKGLVNAGWLYAHEPTNSKYAEGIFRNANKAHCDLAAAWIGPIYKESLLSEKKPDVKKLTQMKDLYEQLGDRFQARGEMAAAASAYEAGIEALATQKSLDPKNRDLDNVIRDLSTKLTILKGNYETADSFKGSIRDSGEQAKLHDDDRLVQSADRLAVLIADAKADMEANPEVEAKVIVYVDRLCKDESDEHEKEAIKVLLEKFKGAGNYRFKQRADEIAIRQLRRHARLAGKAGDSAKSKELAKRLIAYELKVYKERIEKYPTDLRFKYEYGRRLFMTGQFDGAIPFFQQARADAKVRNSCYLYLGRCFYEKQLHSQGIAVLEEAIGQYELSESDTGKQLAYWLARSLEAAGNKESAVAAYGKLLQIDYNYLDVRDRLDALKG